MNKKDLFELANKGPVKIAGVEVEIIIRPDSDGEDWIEIKGAPLSPLHCPLQLGGKWFKYVTDEECEELEPALIKYKKDAEEFCKQAERVVKATLTDKNEILLIDIPESVKSDFAGFPAWWKQFSTQPHKINFINKERAYWRTFGHFTLDLEGELFMPHWSYWLDCAYYIATDKIKSLGENL